jgi:hypothetical protein
VLSVDDEAVIVAFRKHTPLPLDDCLHAFQPTIPHLTRSSLHRCLQRHGISRLPDVQGSKPSKKKFKAYPIGYFHPPTLDLQACTSSQHNAPCIVRLLQPRVKDLSPITIATVARGASKPSAQATAPSLRGRPSSNSLKRIVETDVTGGSSSLMSARPRAGIRSESG